MIFQENYLLINQIKYYIKEYEKIMKINFLLEMRIFKEKSNKQ